VITSGLKAGEKVIVEGIQKVKAGMQVAAKPWIPPAERSTAPVETKPAEHPET
jgi:membrane fusion protein (multidrug efflux system)